MTKPTLGKLPRDAIRLLDLPRLPAEIIEGFKALVDLTGTLSDAMEELGIFHVVTASDLPPLNFGQRIVGPALTVRNVAHSLQIRKAALDRISNLGECEAHNLAERGDVLVLQGIIGCSNMGGMSATIARRQGFAGAVVDASVRDPDKYRAIGWPVWVRGFTPLSGEWRARTAEINGTVMIAGVAVNPGDLVCADDAGICFIPYSQARAVLEVARGVDSGDSLRKADIDNGVSLAEIMKRKYR